MDLYTYISNIDPTDKFKYMVMIFVSILVFQRLSLGSATIIGIIIGVILVYYFNEKDIKQGANYVVAMDRRLAARIFKGTKNMHQCSELTMFLYNIREYRYYNPANFTKLVHIVDKLLGIVDNMATGVERMGDNYQIAAEYKNRAMNSLHSMIYKMPHSPATNDKYHKALRRLEELLNFQLDKAYQYMIYAYGQQPINTETKFIYKNQPQPRDALHNQHYDFY